MALFLARAMSYCCNTGWKIDKDKNFVTIEGVLVECVFIIRNLIITGTKKYIMANKPMMFLSIRKEWSYIVIQIKS